MKLTNMGFIHHKKRDKKMLILAISFILLLLAGCAMQRENSAGRINGVYISRNDFMTSLRGHFTGFMLEKDRSPDEAEKRDLYKETWRDITIHVILQEYFKKYEISVTEKEVIDTLINNVPASIRKATVFQTNGVFDRTKYVQELLLENSTQLDWLKKYYYQYYVPLAKLKPELQRRGIMGNRELKDLTKVLNSSADIDWIVFDPAQTEVKVSQSDIENYYHSNLRNYEMTPTASFGWAIVQVRLSQEDIDKAKTKIDSIYYELYKGKSFSVMVERYSQSQTYNSGGSLGFIKFDELPGEVAKAINGLDKNGITRPLRIGNSWIIYEMVEETKNLVKLNELVIDIMPGEATKAETKNSAIHLRDLAQQLGLMTAASEMSLKYHLSGTVSRDSLWFQDANAETYLMDRAFTQKPGALLEPVYSEMYQAWIVAEVIDVQPSSRKSVISVSDEIAAKVLKVKQNNKAMEDAKNWTQQYKTKQLEKAIENGYQVISTKAVDINSLVMSKPIKKSYVDIINNYFDKKPPTPYFIGDKVLLPVVSDISEINPPIFQLNNVSHYYFTNIKTDWFEKWLDNEIKKAKINIWFSYP